MSARSADLAKDDEEIFHRQHTTKEQALTTSALLGEFMGTMVLILLGNGCVANVVLKHSKAQGSGWIVITTGWAFAVMSAVFVAIACGSRDAHINPAVTLGFAVATGNFAKVVPYSACLLYTSRCV